MKKSTNTSQKITIVFRNLSRLSVMTSVFHWFTAEIVTPEKRKLKKKKQTLMLNK